MLPPLRRAATGTPASTTLLIVLALAGGCGSRKPASIDAPAADRPADVATDAGVDANPGRDVADAAGERAGDGADADVADVADVADTAAALDGADAASDGATDPWRGPPPPDGPIERGLPELTDAAFHWADNPPAGAPFPRSPSIHELVFTGRHAMYGAADTFLPTWGSDDNLYTPWTYGSVAGLDSGARFAWAKIEGTDPLALAISKVGTIEVGAPGTYYGAFPAASLIVSGVWYYGGYAVDQLSGPCGLWCVAGPFIGFWQSTDYGANWTPPPNGFGNVLFGESAKNGGKVKLGGLHAVDFGKDLQNSPDGKAYLIGNGAVDSQASLTWVTGDQVYLTRVALSPTTANNAAAYEFFAGNDGDGKPVWSSSFADIKPLLEWPGQMGSVAMTYIVGLGKYLMAVSRPTDGFNNYGNFDTFFLEADTITGPYRLVQYLKLFGAQAYYVNMPSRFVSNDGQTLWLEYSSGNYTPETPPGSRYAMCLHEVVLDLR